jgi:hypothetical protein
MQTEHARGWVLRRCDVPNLEKAGLGGKRGRDLLLARCAHVDEPDHADRAGQLGRVNAREPANQQASPSPSESLARSPSRRDSANVRRERGCGRLRDARKASVNWRRNPSLSRIDNRAVEACENDRRRKRPASHMPTARSRRPPPAQPATGPRPSSRTAQAATACPTGRSCVLTFARARPPSQIATNPDTRSRTLAQPAT